MPHRTILHRPNVLLAMGWYVHEINVGVARYARSAGWILEDLASHSGVVDSDWSGDGIITLVEDANSPLLGFLKDARVPIIDLTGQLPHLPYPRVLPDNHAIGRLAAEELIGRGISTPHFSPLIATHPWSSSAWRASARQRSQREVPSACSITPTRFRREKAVRP
jgi:hypothetical protein